MRALSIGDKAGMSREVKRAFGGLGLSHLTAVSGFHVGLVAALAMWLLKLSGTASRKRALVAIPAVWSFVGLCGFAGSAVRAALMLTLAALASFLHRRPEGLTLLSIAGCVMFAVAPHMASSLGVRMSFLATVGILMWMRRWRRIPLKGWRSKAVMALGIPVVATAFTAPVVWPAFGQLPILFLPANVLATPFVPLLMVLILIWVLAPGAALPLLSPLFVTVFNGAVHAVERCAQWAPPVLLPLDQFWVTVAGCILCFGTAWALMIRKGVPVFLGGLLLTVALLRGQGGREMAPHCMQIGQDIVCLGGHPPEVFPLRPGKNGNTMKWETRSFLERVSHGSPVVGTRCGDGLVIGACHLRYRHRDGTWQQVSSSRSHSE